MKRALFNKKYLQDIRQQAGLKQVDIAEAVGVSERLVQYWESEKNSKSPSPQHLKILIAYLKKLGVKTSYNEFFKLVDVVQEKLVEEPKFNGAYLRKLRTENGLDQTTLARELGVGLNMISKWERGAVQPSKKNIAKIKEYFKYADEDGFYVK